MTDSWSQGWATGDITFAAEYRKGWGSVFDSTLGGSAANIDITSISATYAHLMLVVYGRGDQVATSSALNLRFNGDTAANYDFQILEGIAASATSAEAFAQTAAQLGGIPAASAGANLHGVAVCFIPHYAGSSNNKAVISLNSAKLGTSTGNQFVILAGGFWRSSAAINRITLLPGSGNFVAGTRVTLYAMGA